MKRTPLNRGTSELKRTPLARTGRIKPRTKRHRDTKESLAVRAAYREANPECEVSAFIRRVIEADKTLEESMSLQEWLVNVAPDIDGRPLQEDHLWGGTGGRLDLWSMLIVTEAAWHDYKTANFTAGLLLFLVVKHSKGEIDEAEFRRCSGYHLKGWLALGKTADACPQWLQPYRIRLIESLE